MVGGVRYVDNSIDLIVDLWFSHIFLIILNGILEHKSSES